MSFLGFFAPAERVAAHTAATIEARFETALQQVEQAETSILSRSADLVASFLKEARGKKAEYEADIATLTEKLRQTTVAIETFEPALKRLDEKHDAEPVAAPVGLVAALASAGE